MVEEESYYLDRETALQILQDFHNVASARVRGLEEGQQVPSSSFMRALRHVIALHACWSDRGASSATASTMVAQAAASTTTTPQHDRRRRIAIEGAKVIPCGKYKGKTRECAYQDAGYRRWVLDKITPESPPDMNALRAYFEERLDADPGLFPQAYMVLSQEPTGGEGDLIATLDTGCSQSCHGELWLQRYVQATGQCLPALETDVGPSFHGIGGAVQTAGMRTIPLVLEMINGQYAQGTLRSAELRGSHAPLLLSLAAQRHLGLVLDVCAETAHSQTLGCDLQLVMKDGLFGLRLLPAHLGLLAENPALGETSVENITKNETEFLATDVKMDERPRDDALHHPTDDALHRPRDDALHHPTDDALHPPTMSCDEREPDEDESAAVGYMAYDHMKGRTMTRSQGNSWKKHVHDTHNSDQCLWSQISTQRRRRSLLPRGCRTFLLEIFAGAALLSDICAREYGHPISAPVDLNVGIDLLTPEGRAHVDSVIERDDPYAISIAPLCSPWCAYSKLNISKGGRTCKRIQDERKRWRPVLSWIAKMVKQRLSRGRQILVENPWGSAMWDEWDFQDLIVNDHHDALTGELLEATKCDQCMQGLRSTTSGLPHMKPTCFLSASTTLKHTLNVRCDGQHEHEQLTSGKACKEAQQWPRKLCHTILDGWCKDLDNTLCRSAFPAEAAREDADQAEFVIDDDEDGMHRTLDHIYGPEDEAAITAGPLGRCEAAEVAAREGEAIHEETESLESESMRERRKKWRELPYAMRVALRRLHGMTGHASPASMQRLLRTAGADAAAIRAMQYFQCPVCDSLKRPMQRPATKVPGPYVFNVEVSVDVFVIRDVEGNKFLILSIVDLGTLFHVGVVVGTGAGSPSSSNCAKAFDTAWMSWAGAPDRVVLDRGTHNRGVFQEMLRSRGVELRYTGLEAGHHLGRGERQGGLMKSMMKHIIHERQLRGRQSIEFVVSETAEVKNSRLHVGGFAPAQWVLGRLPKDLDSLTALGAEHRLGTHQEILDGTSSFAHRMEIRMAAKQAFTFHDSAQRLRASMLRKATPTRGPFVTGDLVCFHRKQGARVGQRWFGPARVVGQEGRSKLWVIHGGIPMTVAVEACRHASGPEILAKRELELRPSRKRRREVIEDDDETYEYPFGDDLAGVPGRHEDGEGLGEDEQMRYFDTTDIADGGLSPSPYSPSPAGEAAAGPIPSPLSPADEGPGIADLPPIPEDLLETDEGERTPTPTVGSTFEPEQEQIPVSRQGTSEVMSPTPLPPGLHGNLRAALHRSPDLLDGHRAAEPRNEPSTTRRDRSRSPPTRSSSAVIPNQSTLVELPRAPGQDRAFLAFLARRKTAMARSKEYSLDKMEAEERVKMEAAQEKEWGNWRNFEAVKVLDPTKAAEFLREHPGTQIVPTRWVLTNKAQPWEDARYKARIVVRGDLERGAAETRTDSPTASSTMVNMLLAYAASNKLPLRGGDITASFLQGEKISRKLILKPPPGGLPGVEDGSLLLAEKPVYGTRDAPRGFWKRLHSVILSKGLRKIPGENSAYVLNDSNNNIIGMLICHVDDLLWAGGERMDEVMNQIQLAFEFGSLELDNSFVYCGRNIEQSTEGIKVTCPNTAAKVRPIVLTRERRRERDAAATDNEKGQLRSVLGSLGWVTRVCRPDIGYQVNHLQSIQKNAVVSDLIACNNLLNYVKETPQHGLFYRYNAVDFNEAAILSITDASYGADYDVDEHYGVPLGNRSQSGRILALGNNDFASTGTGDIYMIEWHSNVLKRVCRSTLQAETLSLVQGYEEAEHVRVLMHGLFHEKTGSTNDFMIGAMDGRRLEMFTDCRSLESHLKQPGLSTVADKRLAIDLSAMRQLVWRDSGELVGDPVYQDAPPQASTTRVSWIETKTMVADSLTKHMKCEQLLALMHEGKVTFDMNKEHSKKASMKQDKQDRQASMSG